MNRRTQAILLALALATAAGAASAQTVQSDLLVSAQISRKLAQDTNARQAAYVLAAGATADSDGFALPAAPTAGTTLVGGGVIPSASGAPMTDGYGVNLGYCAWDNGTVTNRAGYIAGTNDISKVTIAVVSPGNDNIFSTTCAQIYAGTAAQGDDFYVAYTGAQILSGVQGTSYFSDPVATVADLASIAPATLKDGQVRLVKATNQLYKYRTVGGWTTLTGGQWADSAVAGDVNYTGGNVSIGTSTAQRRLTVNSTAVPVSIATTGSRNGIDALDAATNVVNAFFGYDNTADQVRIEAIKAGSTLVLSTPGGSVSVNAAGALSAPQGITSGAISATTLTTSGAITTSAIQSSGAMSITSTALTLSAPTTVTGALTASGGISSTTGAYSGVLAANGGLTATTGTFSGALAANGGLTSTTGTFTGAVSISGALTASGGVQGPTGYFGTDLTNRVINGRNSALQVKGTTSASHDLGMVAWRTDTTGPALLLAKGNNATAGTMTALSSGQQLGNISFGGADGSAINSSAQIFGTSTQAWSGSARGSSLTFSTTPNNSTSLTQALVLAQDQSATFSGLVNASAGLTSTTGTFSGVLTANGGLTATTGSFSGALAANGGLTATTGTFSGALAANAGLTATTGAFSGVLAANGGLTAASGTFSGVLAANAGLTSTTGTFSGALTANGGLTANTATISSAGAALTIQSTSAAPSQLILKDTGSTNNVIIGSAGQALTFQTGGAERMRIDGSGYTLLGTDLVSRTASGGQYGALQVKGTTLATSAIQSTLWNTTAGGAQLHLSHGHSATPGTMTATPSGNQLGAITFGGTNGSAIEYGAYIQAATTQNWTTTAQGTKLDFNVTANNSTAKFTAMTLDQDGTALHGNDQVARAMSGSATRVPALQVKGTTTNSAEIAAMYWGATGAGGTLHLYRGQSGTPGTMTALASGQQLGAIIFGGTDGTLNSYASYIASNTAQAWSNTARGSNMVFTTTPLNSVNQQTVLVLDSEGPVLAGGDVVSRPMAGTYGSLQVKGASLSASAIQSQIWSTSTTGAQLHLSHGHGGYGAVASTPSGTQLGAVVFGGTNGVQTDYGAYIHAVTTQNWASNAMGTQLNFVTTANNSTNRNTAMVIENNGLVNVVSDYGVQTTLNTDSRGFNASTDTFSTFGVNVPHYGMSWKFFSDASGAPSGTFSSWNGLRFYTVGAERIRVAADGAVGIGRVAAGYLLDVNGNIRVNTITTGSDARLKHNISSVGSSSVLSNFMRVRPVIYNLNSDNSRNYGYIAQELRPLFPEMVMEDTNGYLGVQYTQMIPVLTAVAQEQQRRIDDLERRKLDNTVDKWLQSSDDKARMYFERDGKTVLRGHGEIAVEMRNAEDRRIAAFKRNGDFELPGMIEFTGRGGFAFNPTGTIVSSQTPGEIVLNSTKALRTSLRMQAGDATGNSTKVFGFLFGDERGIGLSDGDGKALLAGRTVNGASTVNVLATLVVGDGTTSAIQMGSNTALRTGADGVLQVESANGVRFFDPSTRATLVSIAKDGALEARRFVPTEVVNSYSDCAGKQGSIARDAAGQVMVCTQ